MLAQLLFVTLAATQPVPRPIAQLDQAAESLGSAALSNDWKDANGSFRRAEKATGKLRGKVEPGALKKVRDDLEAARQPLRDRSPFETAQAANQLSTDLLALYGPYEPTVPVDVRRLSAQLRQLHLQGATRRPDEARSSLASLEQTWASVKEFEGVKDTAAATNLDHELAEVRDAVKSENGPLIATSASYALEGVGGIEDLYPTPASNKRRRPVLLPLGPPTYLARPY